VSFKSLAATGSAALLLTIALPAGSFAQPADPQQPAQAQQPAASSQQPPASTTPNEDPNAPQQPATQPAQPATASQPSQPSSTPPQATDPAQPATSAQPGQPAGQPTVPSGEENRDPNVGAGQNRDVNGNDRARTGAQPMGTAGTSGSGAAPSAAGTSGTQDPGAANRDNRTQDQGAANATRGNNRNQRGNLPGTASSLPIMIFASLAALGLAGMTRKARTSLN